jgi:octaprenyl-diphosphate synthase
MLSLADLLSPIREDLDEAARIFQDELVSDSPVISDLCRHVGQFHGKMLRPAVLLLAARAAGELRPAHRVLAAVVEMVHIATLVHDDVLDEADIRRRAATVNRLWGNERAVLMGDFLFSHAFHLCSSLESQHAARVIGQVATTLCEGEIMQVSNRDNFELHESEYFDIITRKTASLIAACCSLGARYAGAEEGVVRRLHEYGLSLGIAFQIVDDLLDLTGDEADVGKSLGRDVHKGKLTLPIIHYLRTARAEGRARLLSVLRGDDPHRYREVCTVLRDTQSLEYAMGVADGHIQRALGAISDLPPSDAKSSLTVMAEFVVARRQ